jgi:hypothetical protein
MYRRALLSSLAALAGGLAGCGASGDDSGEPAATSEETPTPTPTTEGTPTPTPTVRPTEAHTVRVETIRTAPMTGRETRVVVAPDGTLTVSRTCEADTVRQSISLAASTHDAFVETVLAADLSAMAERYECTSECPKDIPGKRYKLTVDGTETSVYVDAQADEVPQGLVDIQREVDNLREDVETPSCGPPST